jgi:hypothetical protein
MIPALSASIDTLSESQEIEQVSLLQYLDDVMMIFKILQT